MCKMKSGIILKDRVFIPDYDSHTDMLAELGIEDNRKNAETLFIRAELYPKNGDVFSPVDEWIYHIDQDILPDWYVENYDKERMIKAVKEWAKEHIHIGVDDLKINAGSGHYVKDCKNIYIYENATVENICENATVKNICGNATVKNIYGNATVEYIYGNATVKKSKGNAVIITSTNFKWHNKEKLILLENSTLKDNYNKVIYQSGEIKLISVTDGKIIGGDTNA